MTAVLTTSSQETVFYIKQGDTLPVLEAVLYGPPDPSDSEFPDGRPINLVGVTSVEFCMEGCILGSCELVDPHNGRVRYVWKPGDTKRPGVFKGEFVVKTTLGTRRVPNHGYLTIHISRSACAKCAG